MANGLLLYHSFPRPRCEENGTGDQADRLSLGIAQLELMATFGFLLTPETLKIPPYSVGEQPHKYRQVRGCFTLIERHDLWRKQFGHESGVSKSHSDLYGVFAVGIDPIKARRFAVAPVSYFYPTEGATVTADATGVINATNLTVELLRNLWELRSLAVVIALLEEKKGGGSETRNMSGGCLFDAERSAIDSLSDQCVARVMRAIYPKTSRVRRKSAFALSETIELALCFFQKTGPCSGSLDYFREREWRIPKVRDRDGRIVMKSMSSDDATVKEMRRRMGAAALWGRLGVALNECVLFERCEEDSFFAFVEEVICPVAAEPAVRDILNRHGEWRMQAEGVQRQRRSLLARPRHWLSNRGQVMCVFRRLGPITA